VLNENRKHTVQKELKNWFSNSRRVVLAGIGNPMRRDDFVGVKIVQNLKGITSEIVFLIECETVPETFVQQIIDFDPTHVLLIDAAILGLEPGETKLIEPNKLTSSPAFSTHVLPLRIFCEYLSQTTKSKFALLLIQPKETDFGEGLSPELETSAKKISETLAEILQGRLG
jgi:hydrogenase 3 maturation protease